MTDEVARRLCSTYLAYRTLGAERIEGPGCVAVRQDEAPLVHDVNHVQVAGEADPAAIRAFQEEQLGARSFRQVLTTSFVSPSLEARLSHEGFVPDPTLQGLLEGELRGPEPVQTDIRAVSGEADWARLSRLVRSDHIEENTKAGSAIYSEELTRQVQSVRRRASDAIHFFMAWVDGEPVAYFSSWPGVAGVGMVEDLFTLPNYRHRGLARALIHHCVADARARGARSVLIGSESKDTPKELYAAMGFRPTCLTWNWLKRVDA